MSKETQTALAVAVGLIVVVYVATRKPRSV